MMESTIEKVKTIRAGGIRLVGHWIEIIAANGSSITIMMTKEQAEAMAAAYDEATK